MCLKEVRLTPFKVRKGKMIHLAPFEALWDTGKKQSRLSALRQLKTFAVVVNASASGRLKHVSFQSKTIKGSFPWP